MPGKRVAVLQSNYLPWKGYFDIIASVDEFILYDDMQYTTEDWRNRNRIKTPKGAEWLTVPVRVRGRSAQRIRDAEAEDERWRGKHWRTLRQNYHRAPHWNRYSSDLEAFYLGDRERNLSAINRSLLETCCRWLGIETRLRWSWEFGLAEGKVNRLVDLCGQAGASVYLTGPSARTYLEADRGPERFAEAGIGLEYMDYSGYPDYPQLYPPFIHEVSILDLLFNTGPEARKYMKSRR